MYSLTVTRSDNSESLPTSLEPGAASANEPIQQPEVESLPATELHFDVEQEHSEAGGPTGHEDHAEHADPVSEDEEKESASEESEEPEPVATRARSRKRTREEEVPASTPLAKRRSRRQPVAPRRPNASPEMAGKITKSRAKTARGTRPRTRRAR